MKKLLLSLLSIGALACSANAMGPLGPSIIRHDHQGDRRTIVVPATDPTDKSAVLGPIRPCGVAVLGPIRPCLAVLAPIRPCLAVLGPIRPCAQA
jgi:hypothetical protein